MADCIPILQNTVYGGWLRGDYCVWNAPIIIGIIALFIAIIILSIVYELKRKKSHYEEYKDLKRVEKRKEKDLQKQEKINKEGKKEHSWWVLLVFLLMVISLIVLII